MEQHGGGQGLRVKRQSWAPGDERSEGVVVGTGFRKLGGKVKKEEKCLSAVINYHRWGCLNHKYLFLTISEAGKSKIKSATDTVSDESLHLLLHKQPSSCCVLMAERASWLS